MITTIIDEPGLWCNNSVHASPRPAQIVNIQNQDGTITIVARCQNCLDETEYTPELQQAVQDNQVN